MSSKFCEDGKALAIQENIDDVATFQIVLGVIIILGNVFTLFPQITKIWKKKSVEGISWLFVLLIGFLQWGFLTNYLIMKYPLFAYAQQLSFMDFFSNSLNVWIILGTVVGRYPIVVMWYYFHTLFLKHNADTSSGCKQTDVSNETGSNALTRAQLKYEWRRSLLGIIGFHSLLLTLAVGAFTTYHTMDGMCGEGFLLYGTAVGLFCFLLTLMQWLPQIVHTIRTKTVGSNSLSSLGLRIPGTLLTLYLMIFATHEHWSTFLPSLSQVTQMTILFLLLLFYRRKSPPPFPDTQLTEIGPSSPSTHTPSSPCPSSSPPADTTESSSLRPITSPPKTATAPDSAHSSNPNPIGSSPDLAPAMAASPTTTDSIDNVGDLNHNAPHTPPPSMGHAAGEPPASATSLSVISSSLLSNAHPTSTPPSPSPTPSPSSPPSSPPSPSPSPPPSSPSFPPTSFPPSPPSL
eukprot:GCRY01004753.1.p1 GENE.GCRY01004753.1~~GCRY01004753.1.p1  ORF type:complete len:461 (-),score=91.93 GCRY01004753.1:135-1517(-)